MLRKWEKDRNSGSALIVVIICMLFIGIIASVILTITSGNLKNIYTGRRSSDNFYGAEEAVDELKNSVLEIARETINEAYKEYLQTYAVSYEFLNLAAEGGYEQSLEAEDEETDAQYTDERANRFRAIFSRIFQEKLGSYFPDGSAAAYDGLMYKYGSDANLSKVTAPNLSINIDNNLVTIRNIAMTYTDPATKDVSSVTTDLVFHVVLPAEAAGVDVDVSSEVSDYCLISDQTIRNVDSNVLVYGNVYGGGKDKVTGEYTAPGFSFSNGTVRFYSDHMVTRSDIKVQDGANLTIKARDSMKQLAGNSNARIWAKNILMDRKNDAADGNGSPSTISIQGECNISDDLTINADNATFTMIGDTSKYHGYSMNSGNADSKSSSSIVINSKNANLDLSRVTELWLFGKSYVELPRVWGDTQHGVTNFQQGESITSRALQSAYLMPGEWFMDYRTDAEKLEDVSNGINVDYNVGHNPMTVDEYNRIQSYINKQFERKIIKVNENRSINLAQYLDITNPCYVSDSVDKTVKYGANGESYVYLYMKFLNPDKAAAYFEDYESKNTQSVASNMGLMGENGRVTVNSAILNNPGRMINTGNIMCYDGTNYNLIEASVSYRHSDVVAHQNSLTRRYSNLCTSLHESSYMADQDLTSNIVNIDHVTTNKVERISEINTISFFKLDRDVIADIAGQSYPAYMISGADGTDIQLANGRISFGSINNSGAFIGTEDTSFSDVHAGIVIAKGNVKVSGWFLGTIVATGDIILEGGAKVYSANEEIKRVLQTDRNIQVYFNKELGLIKDGESINSLSLVDVRYENWQKE